MSLSTARSMRVFSAGPSLDGPEETVIRRALATEVGRHVNRHEHL